MRLLAQDRDDLNILSGHAQDLIIVSADLAYLAQARRFVILGRRFIRDGNPLSPMRVACALRFENVTAVRGRGFDPSTRDLVLNLLQIAPIPPMGPASGPPSGPEDIAAVELIFSGDKALRLSLDGLEIWLEDQGLPYPARAVPDHGQE
jgi:hypothetical protein